MKKNLPFLVLVYALGIATGVAGFVFFPRSTAVDEVTELRKGAVTTVDTTTAQYKNEQYGFTLEYPKELAVKEFDEGNNSTTIVFQKPGEEKGLQIFVTPYAGDITPERIKVDIPAGTIKNPTEVIVGGGVRALHFSSTASAIGDSTEVWFIYPEQGRGVRYLYEVTTYAALDTWLAGILATWKFI